MDPEAWLAYQLLPPRGREGAVLAFRRPESPMTSATSQLRGLDETETYELECADTGRTWREKGRDLATVGLSITADAPRTSRLLFTRLVTRA